MDQNQKQLASPHLSWRLRLFLSSFSFAVDASRRSNGTLNRRFINLLDFKSPPLTKPHKNLKSSDVIVDSSRNLWFRLYTPTASASATTLPVIVFFHGGGFAFMAANSKLYDDFCQRLARELPAVVVSVNYRLTPDHRYPCQYDDAFDVLKFMENDGHYFEGANLKQCFLAGDSAGGNIAHHVALRCSGHVFQNLKVVGILSIQPFFGGEERTEPERRLVGVPVVNLERTDWMWRALLPEGSDRDHPAANVFGPKSEDISGSDYPATIVFLGGFDPLQEWQKRYYEGLKKSGKEAELVYYPNAIHTFYVHPELEECAAFFNKVRDFVQLQIVSRRNIK
ncbi:PREDICTED: probable carboxylesterase 18 [Prunus mume]|uniref:Probable carboxylesterase 18 n=1 Tax=Prunus mume TaxID=102107 RepID=A0ABM0PD01_PRUMU|nr:PREDICTED: probable carboxylesterase 18 [Prunus mume]